MCCTRMHCESQINSVGKHACLVLHSTILPENLTLTLHCSVLHHSAQHHGAQLLTLTTAGLALQVCKSLRFSGIAVSRDYEPAFQRAVWTFQHQRVWCPQTKQLVHMRPLPPGGLASGQPSVAFFAQHVSCKCTEESIKYHTGMNVSACDLFPDLAHVEFNTAYVLRIQYL